MKSKHISVSDAEDRVRFWLEREQVALIVFGIDTGVIIGEGWDATSEWVIWLMASLAFVSFFCFAKRIQAYQRVQLSIAERDDWRERRWEELHQEELIELRSQVTELRREIARGNPHVH